MRSLTHDTETLRLSGRRWLGWETLVWMSLVAGLLFLMGLRNHTLWDYHEPYVGGIIREMADSGDWIVPTLNGRPYLEKPPLFYAFGALCCRIFGSFEPWVLRLPSALLAMATTTWCSYLGWRLSSARAGAWAGFLVCTSYLFFIVGHMAVVDMTLTAAVTFSLGLAFLAVVEPPYRRRWIPLFWMSLGFTFLAKGVFGPITVVLPLAGLFLLQRDARLLRAFLKPNWGMVAAFLLALAWILPLAWRGGGEFLMEVFVRNSIGRFLASPALVPRTGRLGEHVEPWFFYLSRTPGNLMPWLAFWAAGLWAGRPWGRRHLRSPRSYFLPLSFFINLAFLSLSRAKRMVYLLPAIPVTFVQAALWLDQQMPKGRARAQRGVLILLGLTLGFVGLVGLAFPWIVMDRVGMPLITALLLNLLHVLISAWALALMWQRRLPRVLDAILAQFALTLVLFMTFGVPHLDREWRPILEPFRIARVLEQRGARLLEGRLTETMMGYASLEFRHVLPGVGTVEEARKALEGPGPVVLLVEPRFFWKGELQPAGVQGALLTQAQSKPKLWDRTPVLLLNSEAQALLTKS